MLRRVSVSEARRSSEALAAREARAGRAAAKRRNARYRACATAPLARTDGFASAEQPHAVRAGRRRQGRRGRAADAC